MEKFLANEKGTQLGPVKKEVHFPGEEFVRNKAQKKDSDEKFCRLS